MKKVSSFERRQARVRFAIKQNAAGRIHLSVNRSERHIEAQLIDDKKGITLAAASSKEKGFKEKVLLLLVPHCWVKQLQNVL